MTTETVTQAKIPGIETEFERSMRSTIGMAGILSKVPALSKEHSQVFWYIRLIIVSRISIRENGLSFPIWIALKVSKLIIAATSSCKQKSKGDIVNVRLTNNNEVDQSVACSLAALHRNKMHDKVSR